MYRPLIPAFYFPTTTLMVGNEQETPLALRQSLKQPTLFYNTANEVLHTNHSLSKKLVNTCFSEHSDHIGLPLSNHLVSVDISELYRNIYNLQRSSEISVVIADVSTTGFEFFASISHPHIKKIAVADGHHVHSAVHAFNHKLIDLYLDKSDPLLEQQIRQFNSSLQFSYFQNQCYLLSSMLAQSTAPCLGDEKFSSFFTRLCAEYDIVEYYLVENTGSFLLLDTLGRFKTLIVKTQADLGLYYELAFDSGAPQPILEQLASGLSIPGWRPSLETCYLDDVNWPDQLYAAQQLHGQQVYYYALIDLPSVAGLQTTPSLMPQQIEKVPLEEQQLWEVA
jgi:hypothetical protein